MVIINKAYLIVCISNTLTAIYDHCFTNVMLKTTKYFAHKIYSNKTF